MSPSHERSARRPWVPIALGFAMAILIGFSVLQSSTGNSTAIPAPSQYTTPPTSQSAFSNPLVIGGIALVVIIVLALLFLFFRGRGGPSAGRGSSEEPTGTSGAEVAGAETAAAPTASGAGASSFSEENGTDAPEGEGGAGEWAEGNEPKEGDLDSTLSELDELAKTSDEQMPSSEKE